MDVFLTPQSLEEEVACAVGIAGLIEQANEFRSDDGSCCVSLCTFERLTIADAEAYHARIV